MSVCLGEDETEDDSQKSVVDVEIGLEHPKTCLPPSRVRVAHSESPLAF